MMSNIQAAGAFYQTVVDDVINGVRESFLDEGMDEQVLLELKQLWETKLAQTKAIAPTPAPPAPATPQLFASYPMSRLLPTQQQQPVTIPAAHNSAPVLVQSGGPPPAHQHHNQQHLQHPGLSMQVPGLPFGLGGNQMSGAAQTALMSLPGGSMQIGLFQQQLLQQQNLQQMAATGRFTLTNSQVMQMLNPKNEPNLGGMVTTFAPVNTPDQHVDKKPKLMNQVDGLGDSDSEVEEEVDEDEDDDDDEDDNLGNDEDGDKDSEEEPLNSGDDVSDTDPSDVFDSENVVVCQFDKINRCKNKWKFHLKDGIMSLNGKDYVFQKVTGEAEW